MKELISPEQANKLMYLVLIAAPIIGLALGSLDKRAVRGLVTGLAIGIANLILWRIYNGITDHLGLDTVKNLLVNLALFVVVGIVTGIVWAKFAPPPDAPSTVESSGEVV